MSITRVLNEFRPLLRIFDEPLTRSPALWNNNFPARSFLDDPFIRSMLSRPAVDVTEQDDKYVIEADLPGMKKDNVKVRIGDEGRSITIEGKTGFSSTPAGENAADKPTVTDKSGYFLLSNCQTISHFIFQIPSQIRQLMRPITN